MGSSVSGNVRFILIILCGCAFQKCIAQLDVYVDDFSSMCCDWDGHYRVNLIPHPINCMVFYICEPKPDFNGRISLFPTLRECPIDESGNSQYFDFDTCRCVRSHEVTCYNHDITEHYYGFFNCSDKFYENGSTLAC